MTNITRIFSNVGLIALVALLFAGCTLLPEKAKNSDLMYKSGEVTADDESYTVVSDDDSLETIEAELNATTIEDEDFSEIETELDADVDASE